MSIRLDWQVEPEGDEPPEVTRRQWPISSLAVFVAVAALAAILFASWRAGQARIAESEAALQQAVQRVVDLEHQAYRAGDGELFFTLQDEDPAWLAAQLRPENQQASDAGLRVTRVEQNGADVWANVTWTSAESGQTWQKVAFFQWQDGRLVHLPFVDDYWGAPLHRPSYDWGELVFHEADQELAETIAARVTNVVARTLRADARQGEACPCPPQRLPFTLTITPDHGLTAAPNQIRLPSPRLLALDEQGQPSPLFWQQLEERVEAYLAPAVIRFAVPPAAVTRYQQLADAFHVGQPLITVEIVSLEALPPEPAAWLVSGEIDGAAMTPTEAMLAAGLVHDLTDFVLTDPSFDQSDFYEQIWQGAWWKGRMWFMPQAAGMRLLFYDRVAYHAAGRPEPSLRWTWTEMAEDVATLVAAQPNEDVLWGFLDTGRDALFSYAYNWNNDCTVVIAVPCQKALQPADVAAALEWYQNLAGQPGKMPDLTHLSADRRELVALNLKGPRKVAIWVEEPVYFELYVLRQPMGVVPFPGSDRFDGITPLWVRGSFISQYSRQPLAVWQWLKFLSYQTLERQLRLIPARPSVAAQTQYWTTLPRPLAEPMRTAFPFARPVTIAEQAHFSWQQLAAVVSGELSPLEAAHKPERVEWFRPIR